MDLSEHEVSEDEFDTFQDDIEEPVDIFLRAGI